MNKKQIQSSSLVLPFFLVAFSILSACAEDYNHGESEAQKLMVIDWLEEDENCVNSVFYHPESGFPEDNTVKCFVSSVPIDSLDAKRHSVNKVLSKKLFTSNITKESLTKILVNITSGSANEPKLVKDLIRFGASTKEIDIGSVIYGNDKNCEILELVIQNNEYQYRNKTAKNWKGALLALTNSGMHYRICPKAIELLIKYSPDLLNQRDNMSPAQQIVLEFHRNTIQPDLVLKLMTEKNVRMYSNIGNANMIHTLLENNRGSPDRTDDALLEYVPIIVKFIRLGGNMHAENNEGYSALHYLNKFPRVLQRVNTEIEKANLEKLY